MFALFLAAVLGPSLLAPGKEATAPQPPPPLTSSQADTSSIPAEALEAYSAGRYWRASKILQGYLSRVPDPTPECLLFTAQAEARWGDWATVERLLVGKPWLDTFRSGYGWNLLGRSWLAAGRWAEGERALARYLSLATDSSARERGLAEARRGLALTRSGKGAEAVEAFERAAVALPQLGDWLHIFAAEAAAAGGDTATVEAQLGRTEPFLAREWGWRYRVRARSMAQDPKGALEAAEVATGALEDVGRRAEAWRWAGDLRSQRGDTAGAVTAYRRAITLAPQTVAALDAARALLALGEPTPDDQLRVGRLYLRHGNMERGLKGLEAYLATGQGTAAERESIRLEIGRALFRAGRYADAERHLLAMVEKASAPSVAAEALFLAGRSQYRQGQVARGRATFLKTVERYPREKVAAEALYTVADLDHDDGKLDVARQGYRRVATINPGANEAGLALMRLGGLAYMDGDFKGALAIFDEYRSAHPDGKRVQQATYWAARAQQRLGNRSEATTRLREVRRIDPFSWYGIRAAELLGENLWDVPIRPEPLANAKVEGEVTHAFERLDLLAELDERSAASFEVDRLKRHFQATDGATYALAEAFNERGFTSTGIRMGWEIYRREGAWNPRLLRIIYPFPYRELITAEARAHSLDPFFVAALIRQESMFNATVRSPVGAVGLMQVMPATGKVLAKGAGIANFADGFLEHPEINLHLGTTYLAELMGRYNQRVTSVLAAYNAGPNRVSRWSAFPEYRDEELFAERIPFTETRDYVKIVQQNARLYAALYAGPAAPVRTGN